MSSLLSHALARTANTRLQIKPIRDDRNRSVTFLKRKGGLFKKAHELSVLCSVDVAVIIFGHNKKLYEYSSGDINDTIGRFQYVCVAPHFKAGIYTLTSDSMAARTSTKDLQTLRIRVVEGTTMTMRTEAMRAARTAIRQTLDSP